MSSSDRARTFDFNQVIATINGAPLEGFNNGNNSISVEFPEDLFTKVVGNDGDVTRVYRSRTDGMITFRLMYGSAGAALIDSLTRLDRETRRNPVAIAITDTISGTQIFAASAWLNKMPNMDLGNELAVLEFPFDCANLRMELRVSPAQ